jgi:threonine dehydratase
MKHSIEHSGGYFRTSPRESHVSSSDRAAATTAAAAAVDNGPTSATRVDWLTRAGELLDGAERLVSSSDLIRPARLSRAQVGGREVFIVEDTKHRDVAAFKQRGALVAVAEAIRSGGRHVVAASTGNHGKSVGAASRALGAGATVFHPKGIPELKIQGMRAVGANVIESKSTNYDDAAREAERFAETEGCNFVHPFDDIHVVTGQATLLLEIARALGCEPSIVFAPVGGGGLAAGLVAAAHHRFGGRPQIVGVEPVRRASLIGALAARQPTYVEYAATLAQGANVGRVGSIPLEILRRGLHSAFAVSEERIAEAMRSLAQIGIRAEGAGALPFAALLAGAAGKFPRSHQPIVLLVSGASIDPADQRNPQPV